MNYEKSVPTNELPALWKFWRDNGFESVRNSAGNVISWRKVVIVFCVIIVCLFSSGCGFFKRAATSIFSGNTQPDSTIIQVTVRDTIIVPPDTITAPDWLVLNPGDTLILEDSTLMVEVIEADESTWLEWWNMQPEEKKEELLKNKPKLVKIKAISKEKVIPIEVDTTIKTQNPQPQGPIIIADPDSLGSMKAVIISLFGLIAAIVFYLLNRKKNGQNQA